METAGGVHLGDQRGKLGDDFGEGAVAIAIHSGGIPGGGRCITCIPVPRVTMTTTLMAQLSPLLAHLPAPVARFVEASPTVALVSGGEHRRRK